MQSLTSLKTHSLWFKPAVIGSGLFLLMAMAFLLTNLAQGAMPATSASRVYGQPDFSTNKDNVNTGSATNLYSPRGVLVETGGGIYIADTYNHRVLHYPAGSKTADRVYGQPDFVSNITNHHGVSATTLNYPKELALDSNGGLYITDGINHRVLHYPAGSTTADRVYGQPDFTSNIGNNGGISATSLYGPRAVILDPQGGLYIADNYNNRVLHYTGTSTTADQVYGQSNFTSNLQNNGGISASSLNLPSGLGLEASGGLYIVDNGNNRVLHYPASSTTADRVYGQPNFTSLASNYNGVTALSLSLPVELLVDPSGGLYVTDNANNRMLHYSGVNTSADRVYGQPNFTSRLANNGGLSASSLAAPSGVTLDPQGGLYLADSNNNRVLHYSGSSLTADQVYGQPDFVSNYTLAGAATLYTPNGVALDTSGELYVADRDNNRVLHYSGVNTTADRVYGQVNFVSNTANKGGLSANSLVRPQGLVAEPNGGLYIADSGNNRVLHYSGASTTPDRVYGQPDFISNTANNSGTGPASLDNPVAVALDSTGGLYVVDSYNNRVLHYSGTSTSADQVYGQPNFTSTTPATSATGLFYPTAVGVELNGGLYIADYYNNRVLHYSGTTTADRVYGQPDFTSRLANNGGLSAGSLNLPGGLAVDPQSGLYIADSYNHRVLHYSGTSTIADGVYGQPDFISGLANSSGINAGSLFRPEGLALDSGGNLYVADSYNNRVLYYNFAAQIAATGGSGQSATVGTDFSARLVARVQDSNSNPVTSAIVTFTAPTGGPGGTFAGGATVYTGTTDASGLVTATTFTANSVTGVYSVTATLAGVANPATYQLTNLPSCNPLHVTSTQDDASCGTLRQALIAASTGPTKTVTLDLSAGSVITLTTGLTLTNDVIVTTTASCGVGPNNEMSPPVILQGVGASSGNGLSLAGNNRLYGLWVRGFSGLQIKAPAGSHTIMQCVKASKL